MLPSSLLILRFDPKTPSFSSQRLFKFSNRKGVKTCFLTCCLTCEYVPRQWYTMVYTGGLTLRSKLQNSKFRQAAWNPSTTRLFWCPTDPESHALNEIPYRIRARNCISNSKSWKTGGNRFKSIPQFCTIQHISVISMFKSVEPRAGQGRAPRVGVPRVARVARVASCCSRFWSCQISSQRLMPQLQLQTF